MPPRKEIPTRTSFRAHFLGLGGILLVVFGLGCDSGTDVRLPLIQTEEDAYTLQAAGDLVETEIRYSFENRTSGPVYLVNCGGAFGIALDRLEGDQWIPSWGNITAACLSAAISIEAGEVFSDTLHVSAGIPGSNTHPQFNQADPSGTYRIRWVEAYAAIEGGLGSGPVIPEEYRVSNSFELSSP